MRIEPALLVLLSLSACSSGVQERRPSAAPPTFRLNASSVESLEEEPEVQAQLAAVLEEWFGGPDSPSMRPIEAWQAGEVLPGSASFEVVREDNLRFWAEDLAALERGEPQSIGPFRNRVRMSSDWRALYEKREELGAQVFAGEARAFFSERYPDLREAAQLFGAFCARCHGREGGGDGPMSTRVWPRPRDYRRGRFKFAAVEGSHKPRRADLMRTLVHGLPGSAMPSFRALSVAELNALIDYVRLLAIRGEVEAILVQDWLMNDTSPQESVAGIYELVGSRWFEAEQHALVFEAPAPDPDPERLALGRAVFLDPERGNCVRCHGEEGRGDGPNALRTEEDGRQFALLKDEWDQFILPRDLTSGVFRGGGRREDVYLRVHCGIPGTPMPALGESVDAQGQVLLTQEETWSLVDYVLSLSGQGPFGGAAAN